MDELQVTNHADRQRFEVQIGDQLAVLIYRQQGGAITLIHTEVPEALSGRGVGAALAKAALDYARANRLTVIPRCPFVRRYLQGHPEYQDLLDRPLPAPPRPT
jgi:uncharacterized protein